MAVNWEYYKRCKFRQQVRESDGQAPALSPKQSLRLTYVAYLDKLAIIKREQIWSRVDNRIRIMIICQREGCNLT